jgi:hypothetical protein
VVARRGTEPRTAAARPPSRAVSAFATALRSNGRHGLTTLPLGAYVCATQTTIRISGQVRSNLPAPRHPLLKAHADPARRADGAPRMLEEHAPPRDQLAEGSPERARRLRRGRRRLQIRQARDGRSVRAAGPLVHGAIAQAMRHMHGDPARSWTVEQLARKAALRAPRSTTASRAPWVCR